MTDEQQLPTVSFATPWRTGRVLIRITHKELGSVYFVRSVHLRSTGLVLRLASATRPHLTRLDSYLEVPNGLTSDWTAENVISEEAYRAA
jgi:hypothetical protein